MEDSGVVKLYEPSPTPCLYVALAQNMVGRVPLNPLFLAGNSTPTIPHMFAKHKDACFLLAAQTLRQWTDDGAAMSTKLTRGCGRLGAASPAWGACPSCRLKKGMMLLQAKPGASVRPSRNGFARRLQPDAK